MSTVKILIVTFIVTMCITLVFPSFPPAMLLYDLLKIPQTANIGGIPVAGLFSGLTNGFFWLLIVGIIYGLISHESDIDILPPMPPARHLAPPPPEPMLVDFSTHKKSSLVMTKKKLLTEQDVEKIDGIGSVWGKLLRSKGIRTVGDLLEACATENSRERLAFDIGVAPATLLKWVHRADMLRINRLNRKHVALLEWAGVKTVTDLSSKNTLYLRQALKVANEEKNLVKKIPPPTTIRIWVQEAKELEPIIE